MPHDGAPLIWKPPPGVLLMIRYLSRSIKFQLLKSELSNCGSYMVCVADSGYQILNITSVILCKLHVALFHQHHCTAFLTFGMPQDNPGYQKKGEPLILNW
jgi:hypothetical protein